MSDKGGQQVGPSVGPIARMKQQNRDLIAQMKIFVQIKQENGNLKADVELLKKDIRCLENEMGRRHRVDTDTIEQLKAEVDRLKKEAFDYRDGFMETSAELENLRELLAAAERILPALEVMSLEDSVKNFHKAIRKVKGVE